MKSHHRRSRSRSRIRPNPDLEPRICHQGRNSCVNSIESHDHHRHARIHPSPTPVNVFQTTQDHRLASYSHQNHAAHPPAPGFTLSPPSLIRIQILPFLSIPRHSLMLLLFHNLTPVPVLMLFLPHITYHLSSFMRHNRRRGRRRHGHHLQHVLPEHDHQRKPKPKPNTSRYTDLVKVQSAQLLLMCHHPPNFSTHNNHRHQCYRLPDKIPISTTPLVSTAHQAKVPSPSSIRLLLNLRLPFHPQCGQVARNPNGRSLDGGQKFQARWVEVEDSSNNNSNNSNNSNSSNGSSNNHRNGSHHKKTGMRCHNRDEYRRRYVQICWKRGLSDLTDDHKDHLKDNNLKDNNLKDNNLEDNNLEDNNLEDNNLKYQHSRKGRHQAPYHPIAKPKPKPKRATKRSTALARLKPPSKPKPPSKQHQKPATRRLTPLAGQQHSKRKPKPKPKRATRKSTAQEMGTSRANEEPMPERWKLKQKPPTSTTPKPQPGGSGSTFTRGRGTDRDHHHHRRHRQHYIQPCNRRSNTPGTNHHHRKPRLGRVNSRFTESIWMIRHRHRGRGRDHGVVNKTKPQGQTPNLRASVRARLRDKCRGRGRGRSRCRQVRLSSGGLPTLLPVRCVTSVLSRIAP